MPLTVYVLNQFISTKGVYAQDGGSRSQSLHCAQTGGNRKISTGVSCSEIFNLFIILISYLLIIYCY